jgi:hypothetical protein
MLRSNLTHGCLKDAELAKHSFVVASPLVRLTNEEEAKAVFPLASALRRSEMRVRARGRASPTPDFCDDSEPHAMISVSTLEMGSIRPLLLESRSSSVPQLCLLHNGLVIHLHPFPFPTILKIQSFHVILLPVVKHPKKAR